MSGHVELTESELVVVLVVEYVHQVRVERMDLFEFREVLQYQ